MIKRHSHLKIARYHQHLAEKLDMNLSPLQYMMKEYPEIKEIEDMRKLLSVSVQKIGRKNCKKRA